MKEPITGRDLFVISTLCTGFGVLLAWGLFYRWGSAPAIKPVDMAAWVQSIGSVAAILIAVYVPWKQRQNFINDERAKEQARIGVMATALAPALEDIRAALFTMVSFADADHATRKTLYRTILPRHPEFDQFRADLYLLGPIGKQVNEAIAMQTYFLDALDTLREVENVDSTFMRKFKIEAQNSIRVLEDTRDRLRAIAN